MRRYLQLIALTLLAGCPGQLQPSDINPPLPSTPCRSLPRQMFDRCGCNPQYSLFLDLLETSGLPNHIRQEVTRCASVEIGLAVQHSSENMTGVTSKLAGCVSTRVNVSSEVINTITDIMRTAIKGHKENHRAMCLYANCLYKIDEKCTECADNREPRMWYQDLDNDGFGNANISKKSCVLPLGYVDNSSDCDDTRSDIHPKARPSCELAGNVIERDIDHNCNGKKDLEESKCSNCEPVISIVAAPISPVEHDFVIREQTEATQFVEADRAIVSDGSFAIKNHGGNSAQRNSISYRVRLIKPVKAPISDDIWTNCTYKIEALYAAGTESRPTEFSIMSKDSTGKYSVIFSAPNAMSEYSNTVAGWGISKQLLIAGEKYPNLVTFQAGSSQFTLTVARNGAFPHIFGFRFTLQP